MPNLAQELQRILPLDAILASADRCVKGDRVWRDPVMHQLAQEIQRLLQCILFSRALIAALKVIVFGATLSCLISHVSFNAACSACPFSQALIAVLKVNVSDATLSCLSSHKSSTACWHCIPFSTALTAELKVIMIGATLSCRISLRSSKAFLPLRDFLASADRCVKGERVRLDPVMPHAVHEPER